MKNTRRLTDFWLLCTSGICSLQTDDGSRRSTASLRSPDANNSVPHKNGTNTQPDVAARLLVKARPSAKIHRRLRHAIHRQRKQTSI
jgi:hypothetical protein